MVSKNYRYSYNGIIAYIYTNYRRIIDNTKRDDRYSNLHKHTIIVNGMKKQPLLIKPKADSLTDHLFGPPKCESFRPIGPQPYEPVLNNVRTVRS